MFFFVTRNHIPFKVKTVVREKKNVFFVSNINERNVYFITLPNTCIKSNNIKQSQFPLKKRTRSYNRPTYDALRSSVFRAWTKSCIEIRGHL